MSHTDGLEMGKILRRERAKPKSDIHYFTGLFWIHRETQTGLAINITWGDTSGWLTRS